MRSDQAQCGTRRTHIRRLSGRPNCRQQLQQTAIGEKTRLRGVALDLQTGFMRRICQCPECQFARDEVGGKTN